MKFASLSRIVIASAVAFAATGVAKADITGLKQVGDVFVVAMENHNFTAPALPDSTTPNIQQLFGNPAAPYLNSLITPGNANAVHTAYATNYINAAIGDHPSEPNYIWAEAGTNYNPTSHFTVNNDADPGTNNPSNIFSTPHLTAQLNAANISWKNYQEDYQITDSTHPTGGNVLVSKKGTSTTVTNPYYNTKQYDYAAKHNPMAFFTDTQTQNVNTFDQLRSDITSDTATGGNPHPADPFGRYNWITPNQFNDMHSSLTTSFTYHSTTYAAGTDQEAVAIGDNFLATIIPQLEATEAYKNNGAIVIWMDETEPTTNTTNKTDPNRDAANHTIVEIVISNLARGNAYASNVEMNHSSDIKSWEELFGLSYINNALPPSQAYGGVTSNAVPLANDLSSLFVPEPSSLAVIGLGAVALLRRRR